MSLKLTENEQAVLTSLRAGYNDYDEVVEFYYHFSGITEETELELRLVRRACRSLAKKGLAEFKRGLFDDEGKVAGSGYGCTKAGADWLAGVEAAQQVSKDQLMLPLFV